VASSAGTVISVRNSGLARPTHMGARHPRNERRVEQLADGTVETNPMQDVAVTGVHNKGPASGFAVTRSKKKFC
jgi:hypothetical protein